MLYIILFTLVNHHFDPFKVFLCPITLQYEFLYLFYLDCTWWKMVLFIKRTQFVTVFFQHIIVTPSERCMREQASLLVVFMYV